MEEKSALEKRYDTEKRCLYYLREFVEKCKAEGLTFDDGGYLQVYIGNDHISIKNTMHTAPVDQQCDAWADPRKKRMEVYHLTRTPSGPDIVIR